MLRTVSATSAEQCVESRLNTLKLYFIYQDKTGLTRVPLPTSLPTVDRQTPVKT